MIDYFKFLFGAGMPISHKNRFIFVDIPKCAGSSVEPALGMHGILNILV